MSGINATGGPGKTPFTTGSDAAAEAGVSAGGKEAGKGVGAMGGVMPEATLFASSAGITFVNVDTSMSGAGGQAESLERGLEDLTENRASYEEAMKNILSGGGAEDLATLLILFASQARDNALDQRLASRDQARADLEGQAQKTRESAVTQLVSSVVTLAVSVATTVVSSVGAAKAVGSAQKAVSSAKAGVKAGEAGDTELAAAQTQLSNATAGVSSANHMKTQGITSGLNLASQLSEGSTGFASKLLEAEGQELAAKSTVEQSNADLAKKVMDDLEEMVRGSIQFLKEMQRAETDLMASMTRV